MLFIDEWYDSLVAPGENQSPSLPQHHEGMSLNRAGNFPEVDKSRQSLISKETGQFSKTSIQGSGIYLRRYACKLNPRNRVIKLAALVR